MDDKKELISSLKIGHLSLLDDIDRMQHFLRSYNAARPLLRDIQAKLFNHFAKQKIDLYDTLSKLVKDNREEFKMVEFLKVNLNDIKVRSLVFFDEFPCDMSTHKAVNFAVRFGEFSQEIIARITVEEKHLIPMLEKLYT